jgi:hypothetical protein
MEVRNYQGLRMGTLEGEETPPGSRDQYAVCVPRRDCPRTGGEGVPSHAP